MYFNSSLSLLQPTVMDNVQCNPWLIYLNLTNQMSFLLRTPQALVIDYNIYLFNTSSPTSQPVTVTTDGSETGVYNGIPDWVYEGENNIFEQPLL